MRSKIYILRTFENKKINPPVIDTNSGRLAQTYSLHRIKQTIAFVYITETIAHRQNIRCLIETARVRIADGRNFFFTLFFVHKTQIYGLICIYLRYFECG